MCKCGRCSVHSVNSFISFFSGCSFSDLTLFHTIRHFVYMLERTIFVTKYLQSTRPKTPIIIICDTNTLIQNRSDFELGLCFSIGRSMNEDFLWWVG